MIAAMLALQAFIVFLCVAGRAASEHGGRMNWECVAVGLLFAFAPYGVVFAGHAVWVWAFG